MKRQRIRGSPCPSGSPNSKKPLADQPGKFKPTLHPAPGSQQLHFVGDTIRFELSLGQADASLKAYLRTTLGQAHEVLQSIIEPVEHGSTPTDEGWRDLEMSPDGGAWHIDVSLDDVGFFKATAHVRDASGFQHWVEGGNIGISVSINLRKYWYW